MESIDALFLAEVGRDNMARLMVSIDTACAGIIFYIAIAITTHFGFGNFERLLQAAHRIALLTLAVIFAWHAEDIASNPEVHGLTPVNLFLHVSAVVGFSLSAIRLHRAVKNEETIKRLIKAGNGSALSGPFPINH